MILEQLAGGTVSAESDWFTLTRASLQLLPYSDLELSVVGTISPSGPKLAGRHGLGMLSLAADPAGNDRLPEHWEIMNVAPSAIEVPGSGGFGTYLFQGMDFARWDATLRSYSLFAEEVMPHFTGQVAPAIESYTRVVAASDDNKNATAAARLAAQDQWQRERGREAPKSS